MTPEFCVCIDSHARWWLQTYANDRRQPFLSWTIDPAAAHRFDYDRAAIAVAQSVKQAYPSAFARVFPAPNGVHHDSSLA